MSETRVTPWTPAEVALAFGVDPKTVTRWASKGLISYIKTPGGHRRYPDSEVQRLMQVQNNGAKE